MSKKSPLLWIAVGCGALVLVGIVVVVALGGFAFFTAKSAIEEFGDNPVQAIAEMAVRSDPNLQMVSSDSEAGTMVVRNLSEEKDYTLSFEDIAEGRFTWQADGETYSVDAGATNESGQLVVSGPEGETRFGAGQDLESVPQWVPLYPNASSTQNSYSMNTDETSSGILVSETDDAFDSVVAHYESTLEDQGYTVSKTSFSSDGQTMTALSGQDDTNTRSVQVNINSADGKTTVSIQYNGNN